MRIFHERGTILQTHKPMGLAAVRRILEPHIGKRVCITVDYGHGASGSRFGVLARCGDGIGIGYGLASGWEPHRLDEQLAGLSQSVWAGESRPAGIAAMGDDGKITVAYGGHFNRESVPNYTVTVY